MSKGKKKSYGSEIDWGEFAEELRKAEAEEKSERAERYRSEPPRGEQSTLGGRQKVDGLEDLVGAKVIGVGFHPAAKEGGLTIDYEKKGVVKRMVLGYTDLGMWVDWFGKV